MRRFWILILIAGVALVVMSAFQYVSRPKLGGVAPGLDATSLGGEQISLENLKGRPIILHFFATWCGPCVEEFPALVRMQRDFSDTDLAVIGISEDGRSSAMAVQAFLRNFGASFPVILDRGGEIADAYQSYGVPESLFIDRAGNIAGRINNSVNWDGGKVRAKIRELVETK